MRNLVLKCVSNRAIDLSPVQRGPETGTDHVYGLTIGADYRIVGLVLWGAELWALVRDDRGLPLNVPVGLFEQVESSVPESWRFRVGVGATAAGLRTNDPTVAVWGYDEWVNDPAHGDALFEGDGAARYVFDSQFDEGSIQD